MFVRSKRKGDKTVSTNTPKRAKVATKQRKAPNKEGKKGPSSGTFDVTAMREAVATTLSSKQKARMKAAQEIAKRYMKALEGKKSNVSKGGSKKKPKSGKGCGHSLPHPTTEMVYEVLAAIGGPKDWPKQMRKNLADAPVPGMCLGLVFGLGGGGAKASLISESYPLLASFITRWCRHSLPRTRDGNEFPFSSLQVNGTPQSRIPHPVALADQLQLRGEETRRWEQYWPQLHSGRR
jgi:hypothetical protein